MTTMALDIFRENLNNIPSPNGRASNLHYYLCTPECLSPPHVWPLHSRHTAQERGTLLGQQQPGHQLLSLLVLFWRMKGIS